MAARIQGSPPTEVVKAALSKLQILYPPLASRVRVEEDGSAWLTTEGVDEYPLEVRLRTSDDDWARLSRTGSASLLTSFVVRWRAFFCYAAIKLRI